MIGPAAADEETIGMPVADHGGFAAVREDLQRAIADVWGPDNVPERNDRFGAHLSLAYSTGVAAVSSLDELLTRAGLDDVTVVELVTAISLIELNRDQRRYEWREIARVPLGSG